MNETFHCTRNQFLSQEINSCHKNHFLFQDIHFVTRTQFLSKEINSCHKNYFLWAPILRLNLFYQFSKMHESYQKIRLSSGPREFAALDKGLMGNPASVFCLFINMYISYNIFFTYTISLPPYTSIILAPYTSVSLHSYQFMYSCPLHNCIFGSIYTSVSLSFGTSVRRSSGCRSGGRLLATT